MTDPRSSATRHEDVGATERAVATTRVFEVVVAGDVSPAVLEQLGDVAIAPREVRTVLSGEFEDQAQLHGLLARLRAFALEVVEVRRVTNGVGPVENGS